MAIVAHGDHVVVRCRRTRQTLILGPKEAGLVAQMSRPRHVEDLKRAAVRDFSSRDIEKLVVIMRDLGILRGSDSPRPRQRPWSFRLLTIPLSGDIRHPRMLKILADMISVAGAISAIVSAWLITAYAPEVVTALLSQEYLSGSSLATYVLAIILIGFFHESSHAIAIKANGGHVFETGFFLMFAIPAFYVDATGVAMIRSRLGRIQVWCAGLCAQAILLLGCLLIQIDVTATPAWVMRFLLLTSCVNLAMVLANLIPLVRLDGYRVFCELIGVHDLLGLGWSSMSQRNRDPSAGPLERGLAVFFVAITVAVVPCLIITAASMTLPTWIGISLVTLARVLSMMMGCGVCLIMVVYGTHFLRGQVRHG